MTLHIFHNHKFSVWDVDLSEIKKMLDPELEHAFQKARIFDAPERIGDGLSLMPGVLRGLESFNFVYNFIEDQVTQQIQNLDIPIYYRRQKLNLKRCWANRIYKNAGGSIHNHPQSTVMIVYYNIPEFSSDLVFIDPKHSDKLFQEETVIPDTDKIKIKVNAGTCVLHDGRMLHAITKHGSSTPRDVLVFEFDSIYY